MPKIKTNPVFYEKRRLRSSLSNSNINNVFISEDNFQINDNNNNINTNDTNGLMNKKNVSKNSKKSLNNSQQSEDVKHSENGKQSDDKQIDVKTEPKKIRKRKTVENKVKYSKDSEKCDSKTSGVNLKEKEDICDENGLDCVQENKVKKTKPKQSAKKVVEIIGKTIETKPEIEITVRRSSRLRTATDRFTIEDKRIKTNKISKKKTVNNEEISDKSKQINEIPVESPETDIKAILNSIFPKKTNKRRKSLSRKSIGKLKLNLRKPNNCQKLNFVKRDNLEILQKRLGLITKRLSVIQETRESIASLD